MQGSISIWRMVPCLLLAVACGSPKTLPEGGNPADPGVKAPVGAPYQLPPLQTSVPVYELTIPEETLQKFDADPYSEEQPAVFKAEGSTYDVLVRLRGGSSRFFPKRSWRVELPDGTRINGQRKLNLLAEMCDRTLMVEKLAYDLLEAAGAQAARARYVQLKVNGRYEGVYLEVERIDKGFTARVGFQDSDPTIYRSGNQDSELKLFTQPYQAPWEKETNEDVPGSDDLQAFLNLINRGSEPRFVEELEQSFDLEGYLRIMAIDAVISNDIMSDAGIYAIHDQVADVWSYVPWDYNNSASRFWPTYSLEASPYVKRPIPAFTADDPRVEFFYNQRNAGRPDYLPAFNTLATRVVRHPQLRQRYLARLEETMERLFTEEKLHPRIDAMHRLISPLVANDPYVNLDTDGVEDLEGLAKFQVSADYLKQYVTGRIPFLRAEVSRMRGEKLGLGFEEVDPVSGTLRLKNYGTTAVDLAGMVLTADLRRAKDLLPNLPAQRLAPGESIALSAGQLGLTLAASGELGLFTAGKVWGPADVFFYSPAPAGSVYRREADGEHLWKVQ